MKNAHMLYEIHYIITKKETLLFVSHIIMNIHITYVWNAYTMLERIL